MSDIKKISQFNQAEKKISNLLGFLDSLFVAFNADGRGALVVVGNVDDDIRLLFQLVH